MIKEILPMVKHVISAAEICRKDYEKKYPEGEECDLSFDSIEDLNDTDHEKVLYDYFCCLSYKDIEAMEAIMILGRDKDYNESLTPEEILEEEIEFIRSLHGKGDKDAAIAYILGKVKLDKYLTNGLRILGQY